MTELLTGLFDTGSFVPRWDCGNWTARHGWLHILSDIANFSVHTAVPMVIT